MGAPSRDTLNRRAWLSQSLKAIRRLRGRRLVDVAADMGMKPRTYEYFESGRGPLNVDRIHQFADVLDADPYAILMAIEIGSPAFAVRCAGNKMITGLTISMLELDAMAGDDIAQLDPNLLMKAFNQMSDGLASQARERRAIAERWKANRNPGSTGDEGG
jgi:transcriptional regulator with XRE-family HTH domain